MPRIHQLETAVINKIAAGEVIERPANTVKELLENAIDALSTRVDVEIRQGGTELIRVVDNGEGIHPDDLQLAVATHATSKIDTADDLFRVRTMGFRGEALASIAEVSRTTIRSRPVDMLAGREVAVEFGRVAEARPYGCPQGTSVEVAELFANTPVRRKFLKTVATEFGHITEQFTRIALAHPRLHLTLQHNRKPIYELPATDDLLERLGLFYGGDLAAALIGVESQGDDTRMWGYVANPSESKATRKGQYLFLNGRYIQDRSLQHALGEAYRGLLMVGRHPIAFLFIETPPNLVDVNVHPTKIEVRFQDSQRVFRQLLSMIRSKFLSMDLQSDLRVRSPINQEAAAQAQADQQNDLRIELSAWATDQLVPSPSNESAAESGVGQAIFSLGHSRQAANPLSDSGSWTPSGTHAQTSSREERLTGFQPSETNAEFGSAPPQSAEPAESGTAGSRSTSETPHAQSLHAMQIHDCYLVAEMEQGLTVIDQHALHERILYEYFRPRVLEGSVESQRLLVPLTIEMAPRESALLIENADVLSQLGFGIEEFGQNTILLTRYPAMLSSANLKQLVRNIAEQLDIPQKTPTRRDILDELLHMMSCKAAIKAGQRLSSEEIESLLAQRHLIDDAHHCPHGRPTALVLTQRELDRQFGRLG